MKVIDTLIGAVLIGIVVCALAVFVSPAHAGSGNAAGPICMQHVQKIDMMLENGRSKEDILEDFEGWLKTHEPVTPEYPSMVRNMIASAKGPGWPQEAYQACMDAMRGARL